MDVPIPQRSYTIRNSCLLITGFAFDPNKGENSFAKLIRMKLLCPEKELKVFSSSDCFIIHENSEKMRALAIRVCRQLGFLHALGFLRKYAFHIGCDLESYEHHYFESNCDRFFSHYFSNAEKCPIIA